MVNDVPVVNQLLRISHTSHTSTLLIFCWKSKVKNITHVGHFINNNWDKCDERIHHKNGVSENDSTEKNYCKTKTETNNNWPNINHCLHIKNQFVSLICAICVLVCVLMKQLWLYAANECRGRNQNKTKKKHQIFAK